MDEVLLGSLLASTLRVSTPLLLCALAGMFSERSGVVDVGLEGKMLFAAFVAGAVGALSGSTALALAAAMGIAVLLSWMHGVACVSHRGDQVVSGVAINIIAALRDLTRRVQASATVRASTVGTSRSVPASATTQAPVKVAMSTIAGAGPDGLSRGPFMPQAARPRMISRFTNGPASAITSSSIGLVIGRRSTSGTRRSRWARRSACSRASRSARSRAT